MSAAFLDLLGWNGLTAAEQAAALAGAGLGLAAWLLARALFGRWRRRGSPPSGCCRSPSGCWLPLGCAAR
jgi:hypothetical protein